MKTRPCIPVSALLLFGLVACRPNPTPPPTDENQLSGYLTIAAAADLKFALTEIIDQFSSEHGSLQIRTTYGSSGNLRAMIAQGAPFDLFLSADRRFPEMLIASGHGREDTLFDYAVGRIVIWTRHDSPIRPNETKEQSLVSPHARAIAIANPQHAPYGQAAVAALQSLGLYEATKSRFVMGENIVQTAQFIESGAADIGIIALALAVAPPLADRGVYWEIPSQHYPTMHQGGVVVSHASNPEAARSLAKYIVSDAGTAILQRYGFLMPEKAAEQP